MLRRSAQLTIKSTMASLLSRIFLAAYIGTVCIDSYRTTKLQCSRYCLTYPHGFYTKTSSTGSSVSLSAASRNTHFPKIIKIRRIKDSSNFNRNADSKVKRRKSSDHLIVYKLNDADDIIIPSGKGQKEYLAAFAGPQPEPHGKTRIYSIYNGRMCRSILLILYVFC